MSAYLVDNPPASKQFRLPRRADESGVCVVHTAENTPDTVATDGGAEAVANFIRNRPDPGSYHDLCDSDSYINLVPYEAEAFHDGTGSNPHSYGVSGATRADFWPLAPAEWRRGCVRNMALAAARYADRLEKRRGIIIPARRITRAQSEARIPGFISHAERDPTRRSDPGAQFPWSTFFADYTAFRSGEDVDMTPEEHQILERIAVAVVPFYQEQKPGDARFRVQTLMADLFRTHLFPEERKKIVDGVADEVMRRIALLPAPPTGGGSLTLDQVQTACEAAYEKVIREGID